MRVVPLASSIVDNINNGLLTLEKGVAAFIEIFSEQACFAFETFEERLTDKVAAAIVQALKSKESRVVTLDFPFDRISPQIQFIINASKIQNLRSGYVGASLLNHRSSQDLAVLILNNPYLKSLEILGVGLTKVAYLAIMEAVSQSNITKLRLDNSPVDYNALGDCFRKSKIENFTVFPLDEESWPTFAKLLPDTKITVLGVGTDCLAFDGVIEACRKLRSLKLWGTGEREDDFALLQVLPLLNVNYLWMDDWVLSDAQLASSLARSSVLQLTCCYVPLSHKVVQENRQRVGHRIFLLMFQWLAPLAIENNGFNSLPRDVFFTILRQAMQPYNLEVAYYNKVEANARKRLNGREFSLVENRLNFFAMNDAQHMFEQQNQMLDQLRREKTVLQRRNTLLSKNLEELRQTLFSLIPSLPQEALDKLRPTQAFAAPVEVLDEDDADLKKNKADSGFDHSLKK